MKGIAGIVVALAIGSAANARTFVRAESSVTYCGPSQLNCPVSAACPDGLVPWGGGVVTSSGKVTSSYPDENGWAGEFEPARYEYGDTVLAAGYAFVNCSPAPAGYETIRSSSSTCTIASEPCSASMECPTGKIAISGGVEGFQSHFETIYPASAARWDMTWFPNGDGGAPGNGWAWQYLTCADAGSEPPTIARGVAAACGDTACGASVGCPSGQSAYAVGILGGEAEISALDAYRDRGGGGWYKAIWHYGPDAFGYGTPFAMCAAGETVLDAVYFDGFDG